MSRMCSSTPEHRGRGIGRMIFRDLARRALAEGCAPHGLVGAF